MTPQPQANTANNPAIQPAAWTSKHVEADGLKLHYLDYGTPGRPPMLCVHGGAAHAHWFDFTAPFFAGDYHVRAPDLRGHGDSDWGPADHYTYARYAADLDEAVQRLDLRDFVLVGHSMGGMVALTYAATHPGRVAKLIIIDSLLRMTQDHASMLHGIGNREGGSYARREEFIERYRLRPSGTTATAAVMRHVAEHGARQFEDGRWRAKFDRNVYARRNPWDGLPFWGRIGIPALVIKGALSPRISPEVFAQIRGQCPQVELASVSNSHHHVTLDNPAECARAMRAFLAQHV